MIPLQCVVVVVAVAVQLTDVSGQRFYVPPGQVGQSNSQANNALYSNYMRSQQGYSGTQSVSSNTFNGQRVLSRLSAQVYSRGSPSQSSSSCKVTAGDVEGPYYKPNSPLQQQSGSNNIPSVCRHTPAYDRVYINGTIRYQNSSNDCGTPIRALVDVWQANEDGAYSPITQGNNDFTCRSRFYTSSDGKYMLSSIFPGRYECLDCDVRGYRPAHIHFKITPVDNYMNPTGQTFTTQLYFALDRYLSPVDACGECASSHPSLITHVQHYTDIKTYEGTWDILLASPAAGSQSQARPSQSYR